MRPITADVDHDALFARLRVRLTATAGTTNKRRMSQTVELDLEEIGRTVAQEIAGDTPVEAVEAHEGLDWTNKPAYYFAFLIEEKPVPPLEFPLMIHISMRLRAELLARGTTTSRSSASWAIATGRSAAVVGASDLLAAARLLVDAETGTEAHYRRAVSTAYYALFHHVLGVGAARFLQDGSRDSAAYAALYRGFSHGRMKAVCEALGAATFSRSFVRQFRRTSASADMLKFASTFVELQEERHLADYDPLAAVTANDAGAFISSAEAAVAAFDRADPAERDDVLALMLTSPRA